MRLSLQELRRRYVEDARPLPAELEAELRADPRPGARMLLAAIDKRRHANRAEGQRLRHMVRYEEALWRAGTARVAGVDEAGMSPLAGPVAAAAVILPIGCRLPKVNDSKQLDADTREELAVQIRATAVAWSVAFVEPDEIDRLNIYWAGIAALQRAVLALTPGPEHVLVDARRLRDVPLPQQAIVKGDEKSLTIAAASILAKTARDARMRELDERHPGYGFARHKGYPVPEHYAALKALGACAIHRRTFAPVREALGLPPLHGPPHPPGGEPEPLAGPEE